MSEMIQENIGYETNDVALLIDSIRKNKLLEAMTVSNRISSDVNKYKILLNNEPIIKKLIEKAYLNYIENKNNIVYDLLYNIFEKATINGVKIAEIKNDFFNNLQQSPSLLKIKEIIKQNNIIYNISNANNVLRNERNISNERI